MMTPPPNPDSPETKPVIIPVIGYFHDAGVGSVLFNLGFDHKKRIKVMTNRITKKRVKLLSLYQVPFAMECVMNKLAGMAKADVSSISFG